MFAAFCASSSGIAHADDATAAKKLSPNELGKIMVLMYHDIHAKESAWRRTPENFRKDLEQLYSLGYRPISLNEFVDGKITTARGFSPVVITFDDGTSGQFRFVTDSTSGKRIPDNNSAVGILKAFGEAFPDFPLEATFFLHGSRPFGVKSEVKEKLHYLLDNGMDIGNHTTRHQNLGKSQFQTPGQIQSIIGRQARFLQTTLSRFPTYSVNTLALCYGRRPKYPWLQRYLHAGKVDGFSYKNVAVLNVGSGPSYSPYDKRFTPLAIPRIRASERNTYGTGIYDWLRYFEEHPEERFVSDGDKDKITIPAGYERNVGDRYQNRTVAILNTVK